MDFEWDKTKRQTNIKKHGIDFVDAESIFNQPTVTIEDIGGDYDEQRWISLGLLHGILVVVVIHTERQEKIRLISIRKATKNEQKIYFSSVKD